MMNNSKIETRLPEQTPGDAQQPVNDRPATAFAKGVLDAVLVAEGNKLIAGFMGWRFQVRSKGKSYLVWNPEFKSDEPAPNDWVFATWVKEDFEEYLTNNLKYHSSWDWLMSVVEKIESLDSRLIDCRIKIETLVTHIYFYSNDGLRYEWSNGGYSKIDSVWTGVKRFIRWYNDNAAIV